ncbi:diguanylate cyclase (GGDEF) domain-containing protein [Geodermatophilus telluris]|uniref:Diguanylate cyclase (GGDEF) domain-containing protein n=1 Tax=Geodermatophilus telluris TaxID=1190417 RepID=A0A1G6MFW3_9ACTN|nr:EAL domain-containing protein [Geodermatophilus telluris]SDC54528.1 diguanylate cyclase (GGDEF) domain-containing protein [Geodermatophilus telluris]
MTVPPNPEQVPAPPSDAEAALAHRLAALRHGLGADRLSLWWHETATGLAVPFAVSADGARAVGPVSAQVVARSPFLGPVLTARRPVTVEPGDAGPAAAELAALGLDDAAGTPLVHGGEVVGALVVEPARAARDPRVRRTARSLAPALVAASARRAERRRLVTAEVLLELVEGAPQARSLDHLLGAACERLAALGGVDRACVFLLEDGRPVPSMAAFADGRRDPAGWQRFRAASSAIGLVEQVARTGVPATADRGSDLLADWWAESFAIGSLLAVPLGRAPDVVGVLTLDSAAVRPFSQEVRRLAAAAGAHLGGVVGQARAAQARADELVVAGAVRQLLVEGAGATGVAEAAGVLAAAVQRLAGTDRGAAYLVDGEGLVEDIRLVGWSAEAREVLTARVAGRPAAEAPLWRRVAELRRPVFVEDARACDLLAPQLVESLGLAAYVAVPVLAGDRLLGMVVCGAVGRPVSWSAAVREAVARIVLEGALVVENAALRATEQLRLAQLAREAHHDPLTGLANRRRFTEEVERTIYAEPHRSAAVLMLDLDRFKEVNDSFGHSVGDDLLCLVGPRLQQALAPGDLLARMGGDEFAVLLPDADAARAREVADGLGSALRQAFVLDGMPLHVDASIGVALCPEHGRDRSLLLARADTAMYGAKRGREGARVWAPEGSTDSRDRLQTLEQLRVALDTEQLVPHYQPKLDLRTGDVAGVEALVRWEHPERGLLAPDVFLPLAEQAGLMRRLTLRVLERSLLDLGTWRDAGHELTLAVNLSVSNLQDVALPEQVALLLETRGVPAAALVLEITEDVLMADAARSQQVLAGLRRLGVRLSVDDYGTGYSSLTYLRALPVDELKLDRSFVTSLTRDPRAGAIVRSTQRLSQDLGMTFVVEGVEDAATLELLRSLGCDVAQGFYVARPMPAERFLEWLQRHHVRAAVPRQRAAR